MATKNFRVRQGLTIGGTTSGSTSLGVGATGSDLSLTLPTAYATTTGDLLSSTTAGVLSWVPAPAGTTYTIDSSTATGGANFNLVGSDATTDTIKFAEGSGMSVVRTDANTITFANTSPGTTYAIDASTVSGGANFNLTGSDATTDTIKFASGSGITVTRTNDAVITITNAAPAETYTIDATTTSGGANFNLTSPSATDSIAFKGTTGTTVTRTSADIITISGTTYTQDASTTTGGANLNLVGTDSTTDSVAFKGSGSTTVTRTDANTITITSTGGGALPQPPSSSMTASPWSLCPGVLNIASISSQTIQTAQTVLYTPFYVSAPITLTEVMLNVSTATTLANCSAMIYISEVNISGATGWQPTANLSGGYLGEIANITTTGQKTITGLSTVLPAGAYLMVLQLSNFTGTLQTRANPSQCIIGSGYAGATSDFTSYNWRRTGVTYTSGTPAAVGNWSQFTGAPAGISNWIYCKWTVN
jgi:hypothetical protein